MLYMYSYMCMGVCTEEGLLFLSKKLLEQISYQVYVSSFKAEMTDFMVASGHGIEYIFFCFLH